MYEGSTEIKNRTGFEQGSIALARFGGGGGIGPVLVRTVLRYEGLR